MDIRAAVHRGRLGGHAPPVPRRPRRLPRVLPRRPPRRAPRPPAATSCRPTSRCPRAARCAASTSPTSRPAQAKYVTALAGSFVDFVVDIRVGSPTFGQWDGVALDTVDRRAVYLSEGLGHAFCALEDGTTAMYLCSAAYNPDREHGIHPLDPEVGLVLPGRHRAAAVPQGRRRTHARGRRGVRPAAADAACRPGRRARSARELTLPQHDRAHRRVHLGDHRVERAVSRGRRGRRSSRSARWWRPRSRCAVTGLQGTPPRDHVVGTGIVRTGRPSRAARRSRRAP